MLFWKRKAKAEPKAEPKAAFCNKCTHRSEEKIKLNNGDEEYCCMHPKNTVEDVSFITGQKKNICYHCKRYNNVGQCRRYHEILDT